ncbi:Major facilitator superfamily protein [Rhynchospora pubera]|uniref:Major facilitator superfamily protein n=1 Tax=Rhynchospora pubera TaxID=906938 RepID=A0AAV8G7D0_9POAL|nr:Major facilitator superfamily protein [Rhynchospora pubera]
MRIGEKRRTLLLVNLASIMDNADGALLPAVYKEVGATLHTTPVGLGSLTLLRSVVQASCYPLAAYMASRYNRAHVIALGAFLWASATFLVAMSDTFLQIAISRGLNGIGLALAIPAIQSLVADSVDEENRGAAFGWLQFTGFMGCIVGSSFSILLAPTTFLGIAGWRIAFHLVAIISIIVGLLIWLYAVDPCHVAKPLYLGKFEAKRSALKEAKEFIKEVKTVIQIPTFLVIIAQGVPGNFAGAAFSFLAMWLELIGFSHVYTSFLLNLSATGVAIGGVFGGIMGDILAQQFPNAGRIFLSQISSGSEVPLAAILLLMLPTDPSSRVSYAIILFIMGLMTSWDAPATNNPIFAEIVPEKARTSIYALDRSLETILASFAPPTVGFLAEKVYGFKIGDNMSDNPETNQENAASLAKAMYTAVGISMSLCCLIYSFLYCTYPRDRERAKMNYELASEMQNMESEDLNAARNPFRFQNFESEHEYEMDLFGDKREDAIMM